MTFLWKSEDISVFRFCSGLLWKVELTPRKCSASSATQPFKTITTNQNKTEKLKYLPFLKKPSFFYSFILTSTIVGSFSPKMDKIPIFSHLGPRYHFLITRKVISGQKYYRNAKKLKKSHFFTQHFFLPPKH